MEKVQKWERFRNRKGSEWKRFRNRSGLEKATETQNGNGSEVENVQKWTRIRDRKWKIVQKWE